MDKLIYYIISYLILNHYICVCECLLFKRSEKNIRYISIEKIGDSYNVELYYNVNDMKIFEIDLQNNITFTTAHYYNKINKIFTIFNKVSGSITYENKTYPYSNSSNLFKQKHKGKVISSYNISFLYFFNNYPKYDALSFAYDINEPSLNFVYSLYQKGQLNQNGFGVYITEDIHSKDGKIYLGSFPSNYTTNRKAFSVKIDNNNNNDHIRKWHMKLNAVSFGNDTLISVNENAFFQLRENDFYAPMSFIENILSFINKNGYKDVCYYHTYYHNIIQCSSCEPLILLGDFVFYVNEGSSSFTIPNSYIYKQSVHVSKTCTLNIKPNSNLNNNQWIFDSTVFKLYNIYFDYSRSEITLYNKVLTTSYEIILFMNIFILLLSNVFLYYSTHIFVYK